MGSAGPNRLAVRALVGSAAVPPLAATPPKRRQHPAPKHPRTPQPFPRSPRPVCRLSLSVSASVVFLSVRLPAACLPSCPPPAGLLLPGLCACACVSPCSACEGPSTPPPAPHRTAYLRTRSHNTYGSTCTRPRHCHVRPCLRPVAPLPTLLPIPARTHPLPPHSKNQPPARICSRSKPPAAVANPVLMTHPAARGASLVCLLQSTQSCVLVGDVMPIYSLINLSLPERGRRRIAPRPLALALALASSTSPPGLTGSERLPKPGG